MDTEIVKEDLRKWFKDGGWNRYNTKGEKVGKCAREDKDGDGKADGPKPKCLPASKAASLGKKKVAAAVKRKRAEDPNPDRTGAAKNVKTESTELELRVGEFMEACWKGYEKKGMKTMFGKRYPNCVKKTRKEEVEQIDELINPRINLPFSGDNIVNSGGGVLSGAAAAGLGAATAYGLSQLNKKKEEGKKKKKKKKTRKEEVELDEIAPALAIPLVAAGGYAAYKGIQGLKKKADSALDNARQNATLNGKPFGAGARQRAIEKNAGVKPGTLNRNMQRLRNSYEPEGEVVSERSRLDGQEEVDVIDEKFKSQYGDKTKLSQSSERKSLGRGSSIKDGSKKSGYESKKEFRDQSMKLRKHRERFGDLAKESVSEGKSDGDPCWDSHKQVGMKKKGGKMVPNCVPKEEVEVQSEGAAWTKKEGKNEKGGLNEKGRKSYERENPGSDLKRPSKKVGNKRRASFCARMKGMRKRQKPSNNTGEDRLSKSLRAWNC